MRYAEVVTPARTTLVSLDVSGFGRSYKELFNQTDLSGSEIWTLYSHNNFSNPLQQADEQRYQDRGYWAELFRDIVRDGGKGTDANGRLNLNYISHAGTEWEQQHNVRAPKSGWYVPTDDGIFVPGTLIPFETVNTKKDAVARLERAGIPPKQVSCFYRLNDYKDNERFVGRDFYPGLDYGGRFGVGSFGLPSLSGGDRLASRPAYETPEIVMTTAQVLAK